MRTSKVDRHEGRRIAVDQPLNFHRMDAGVDRGREDERSRRCGPAGSEYNIRRRGGLTVDQRAHEHPAISAGAVVGT